MTPNGRTSKRSTFEDSVRIALLEVDIDELEQRMRDDDTRLTSIQRKQTQILFIALGMLLSVISDVGLRLFGQG